MANLINYVRRTPNHSLLSLLNLVLLIVLFCHGSTSFTRSETVNLDWKVEYANVTRLCHTKSLVSINGQFPGPTVYVREGDTVIVNVTNLVKYNVTLHWHGVRQLLSAWADGPAYITQCPIQHGKSYIHKFRIVDQRGTLFYHAHISWLRATVYGAFIIRPKINVTYPLGSPVEEIPPLVIGEWWNTNVEDVIAQALAEGGGYTLSDAITINGQPGALYDCSIDDTPVFNVTAGKKYLLRIINAAMNFQMFVGVANHSLTVVELDAEYAQPYVTETVVLAPGQTTNVLLTANKEVGQYFIAVSVFSPANASVVEFPATAATAVLCYSCASANLSSTLPMPTLPNHDDVSYVSEFTKSLRGQPSSQVPQAVDEDLFFTIGYATQPCSTCSYLNFSGNRIAASVNNVTFKDPTVSLLQAYYNNINGVYDTDFPSEPLYMYNYTGPAPSNQESVYATKVKVLEFGSNVQIVFQDTSTSLFDTHPMHLHGQNFYIVGTGTGTYNSDTDPMTFNLQDPPSRNTVAVPFAGWAVVRFRTTNPGVWFMHCHFDMHTVWGMSMAFIVKNGKGVNETLPPPPSDLPPC